MFGVSNGAYLFNNKASRYIIPKPISYNCVISMQGKAHLAKLDNKYWCSDRIHYSARVIIRYSMCCIYVK